MKERRMTEPVKLLLIFVNEADTWNDAPLYAKSETAATIGRASALPNAVQNLDSARPLEVK
jgi:hypothetical protein